MSIKFRLQDGDGSGLETHVHKFATAARKDHVGTLVLTERFVKFDPAIRVFLNDDFGAAMNQNIAFTGTPRGIHNGIDNLYWTGAAVAGTWDFADTVNPFAGSACVSLTSGNNNDEATFIAGAGSEVDFGSFTAVTGQIRLETYDANNNSINLQFQNDNLDIGDPVNINNFIDTGLLDAYQGFVIPKADFNITTETVDEVDMSIARTGGAKPTFRVDAWQVEASGTPAVFKASVPIGKKFYVDELRVRMEDAFDSTLANASVPNFPIDQLLGVSALSNGVVFSIVRDGKVVLSVNLKDLGDFLSLGGDLTGVSGNATNSGLTIALTFIEPVILEGGSDRNFMSFTISDNISGLTRFTAVARGSLEI